MALDTYMQIEGIPGESLDAVFKDWIELCDFDVGASQPVSVSDCNKCRRCKQWSSQYERFFLS
ncbi:hypothetical protein ALP54_05247 [Pseudomonas amygdali pv. lachrymans]|nr:hypothetical protein ALP54_05247 [Pseudomonas amygdali pv. lachrymans]